jgi:fructokinase
MNQIIVGMGEALWDVLPEGKKIGGAPANFAYHVSQFGFDSRVVSAIGDDKLGNEILENFDGKNLKYQIRFYIIRCNPHQVYKSHGEETQHHRN